MTNPKDDQSKSVKCPNCGHDNLQTAKICLVCDTPLTYTTRFQRKQNDPTGLLPPTPKVAAEQESQRRIQQEAERLERETQERMEREERAKFERVKKITDTLKTSHKCPDCGHNNRIGDYFCAECAAVLSPVPAKESPADITQEMKALKFEDIAVALQNRQVADVSDSQPSVLQVSKPTLKTLDGGEIPDGCFQFTDEMMLRLTDLDSDQYLEKSISENKPLLVGRSHQSLPVQPDIDLTPLLEEQHGISRRHALIRLRDMRLELQDLNSTNGTGINGFQFRPKEVHELRHGDIITLGRVSLYVTFFYNHEKVGAKVTEVLS